MKLIKKFTLPFMTLVTVIFTPALCFAAEAMSLGEIATNVTSSMGAVAKLITAISYVVGIGFAMMGLFKLKAHKDNPVQVPLSQAFVLILISACLVFLPSLISTTGKTVWKNEGVTASADGSGLEYLHKKG